MELMAIALLQAAEMRPPELRLIVPYVIQIPNFERMF